MDFKPTSATVLPIHEPGIKSDQVINKYDNSAKDYDKEMIPIGYRAPDIAADEVLSRIPASRRSQVKMIDVAAGTGRIGVLLKDKGFTHIDALDPSEGMIDILKKTGFYKKAYTEFLGIGQNSIPDDVYDILVIAGGMGEGHIPVESIDDMIRMTKSGGLVIIVMRKEFLEIVEDYKGKLVPYIDNLEKQGKWSKVEVKTVPNYCFKLEGVVFTYKVT